MFENLPRLNGKARVELIVNGASIVIELDGDNAPITAGNFVDLVERGIYDGVAFHRVVREPDPFVVQGGDPQSLDPTFPIDDLGTGGFIDPDTGEERNIPLEIKLEGDDEPIYNALLGGLVGNEIPNPVLENDRGAIAMARSRLPDSASSQFYFPLADADGLNGNFAVFGRIVEGLELIDSIEEGDRITDAEVIEGIENLQQGDNTEQPTTIANFEVIGNSNDNILIRNSRNSDDNNQNILNALDLQIVFGLAGDDSLSSAVGLLPGGEETTILVGGSGNDEYRLSGNSTAIIFENGNSSQDVAIATDLTISTDTSFIAEIDNRHLYLGDLQSDQYAILVDWQEPENRIETFELSGVSVSYDLLANNFRGLDNYAGNFTWEELEQQDEINDINLERLGLTPSSIDDAINQVSARASELEAPVLNTPIYRFQNSDIPGTYLFVAEAERANILENFTNFEEEGLAFRVAVEPGDDLIPLYRFQSTITPGTYLLAGEQERASINQDFADSFIEEGLAFYVYGAGSGLGTDFSRFQNRDRPGTYLFATGEERANIRENFTNFEDEGIAFEVDI
ncbi:MAG: peptidylprolyl isomerase [Xenococcaceae cyanobacterium MO_167.B27]|nr:peptidylprolyl isomerase [Xenococcaceae cyanobacterium MO_167.B27]